MNIKWISNLCVCDIQTIGKALFTFFIHCQKKGTLFILLYIRIG